MAFDEARGNTVLFGGANQAIALSDTWTWNGSQWTQRDPDNSPEGLGAMAYATAIGRPVLLTPPPPLPPCTASGACIIQDMAI